MQTIFEIVFSVVTLAFVLMPLLTRKKWQDNRTQTSLNVGYYKEALAEVEDKARAGELDSPSAEEMMNELKKNLLAEETDALASHKPAGSKETSTALVAVIVALVLGIGWYGGMRWGQSAEQMAWQFLDTDHPERPGFKARGQAVLDALGFKQNAVNSTDLTLLMLQARTAVAIEDYKAADQIYTEVLKQARDDKFVIAQYVEVRFLMNDGQLDEKAIEMAKRGLLLDPAQPKILNLFAVDAYKRGEFIEAIRHWRKLLQVYPKESPDYQQIMNYVAQAYVQAGKPDLSELDEATDATADAQAVVRVKVDISDEARQHVSPSDRVFVFARDAKGGRVPVAAKQVRVAQLPATLVLTEADAMMAARNLTQFPNVVVGARVSATGQPIARPGDWQALSGPIEVASEEMTELLIAAQIDASGNTPVVEVKPKAQPVVAAASVRLRISIADEVRSQMSPSDRVFVFARDATGGRMPVAAKQLNVAQLPITVTLTEQDAMMPTRNLSQFPQVIVGARVSKSGQPIAQSGDWEVLSKIVSVADGDEVALEIRSQIP